MAQWPLWPVQSDGQINHLPRLLRLRGDSVDHGTVTFLHMSVGEGIAQRALCYWPACHHHQAGGRHVQPMHDQRIRILSLHATAQAILFVLSFARH